MSEILEFTAIKGVRPLGADYSLIEIKQPRVEWALQDLSAKSAGRTEDNTMQKKRIGQVEKLTLTWKYLRTPELSKILQLFNNEYVEIEYFSPLTGFYQNRVFYTGDRKAVPLNYKHGAWESLSFSVTSRGGEIINV